MTIGTINFNPFQVKFRIFSLIRNKTYSLFSAFAKQPIYFLQTILFWLLRLNFILMNMNSKGLLN